MALGGTGNIFLAGTSASATWPAPWTHRCATTPQPLCSHVFLRKLGPDGSHVYYTVQLGGGGQDRVSGLALDQAGAYLEETSESLSTYLTLYQQQRAELLKRRGGLVPLQDFVGE